MSASLSDQLSFGATVRDSGVEFLVWAPHAERVAVVGSFNDWDAKANPLTRDEHGNWSGDASEAKVGDEYRYEILYGDRTLSRLDPYARALTDSKGNSVITDPRFDWGGDGVPTGSARRTRALRAAHRHLLREERSRHVRVGDSTVCLISDRWV